MSGKEGGSNKRMAERICLDAGVDFFVDADIVGAYALDVSQSGISFVSPEPLMVEMRLNVDGEREERRARLVWAKQQSDGSVRYGLEFCDGEEMLPPDDI
ncbi:MAG TPA: PilZ domain-containing protein [Candidatus Sumerlaeota bacterium]|nr:PilZ domain-containing protein [Candidatus Sumerlaeota bacterium]HPR99951.1 PilZ domain-containing protein [Candidatus Sumerlaeota bacterium]